MKNISVAKSVIFCLAVILLLSTISIVFAHPNSQKGILEEIYDQGTQHYYVGGEDVGWIIDEEHHTSGTTITYSFSPTDVFLNDTYKSYVIGGASKWSGTMTIINKTDGSGDGLIRMYHEEADPYSALTFYRSFDSNGHLSDWIITMNHAKPISAVTLAHEFGHVIGLVDLYVTQNTNKIMYGYATRTATMPNELDKWGAKVITGIHTSHTWGYKYHSTTISGTNRHVNLCTACNGFPVQKTVANCIYNANNICRFCGTPAGSQEWSLRWGTQ